MPKKHKKLSTNPVNVRARERRAALRAKKKRRSEAAKKGWATRRKNRSELLRIIEEQARKNEEQARKNKEQAERILALEAQILLDKRTEEERQASIEEGQKYLAEMVTKGVFQEYTPTERLAVMEARWTEIENIVVPKGQTLREAMLLWVQRNMFDVPEFWAVYRRRQEEKTGKK